MVRIEGEKEKVEGLGVCLLGSGKGVEKIFLKMLDGKIKSVFLHPISKTKPGEVGEWLKPTVC